MLSVSTMNKQDSPGRPRREASVYLWERWRLSYTPATLARLASLGTGPIYRKRGPYAYYQDEDLDAFAHTKISGPMRKASEASSPLEAA
jgi:hypothetical protein